jgi:hypothetical protein
MWMPVVMTVMAVMVISLAATASDDRPSFSAAPAPTVTQNISLDSPGSGPGWSVSGLDIIFNTAANGEVYSITQSYPNTATGYNIILLPDVNTDIIIKDIFIDQKNIELQGNAVLELWLQGTNRITSGSILVPNGTEIDIYSFDETTTHSITINAPAGNAGIGGGAGSSGAGSIRIDSGRIVATGGAGGAGIGGGAGSTGGTAGTISIGGSADIKATGGAGAAGIGGGRGTIGGAGV